MTVFEGQDISCVRGERLVFERLGFAVDAGGALVLQGPNGSGKSSLLRLMAGLARPVAGRIAWQGAAIGEDPEAHALRLHYVAHLDAVKPAFRVRENLSRWAGLRGAGEAGVARALDSFGLAALADLPARLLSAGQKRRLALARLLAVDAPLWLLDEPTVALDRESVAALTAAIARHRASGGIAVVSTNVALDLPGAATLTLTQFAPAEAVSWAGLP
jgi:heme exporter protein A